MSATPYFQFAFQPAELSARRRKVLDAIGPHAVAVLQGAPATGGHASLRQTNEFFYLSGVEVPHAYLLLDGRSRTSILYLRRRDEREERSEGSTLNSDQRAVARRITGVEAVSAPEALARDVRNAAVIYTPFSPAEGRQMSRDTALRGRELLAADPWARYPPAERRFVRRLRRLSRTAAIRDLSPILDRLRLVKSPAEIELLRRAGRLSALAVTEAMRCTKAGLAEYHLAAVAEYVFLVNGAGGAGYRPIVASGANAWNAHYYRNNCALRRGDLILMDCAPDCCYYTSDIGRMWPVSGRYSRAQRELYGFMVEYHKTLLRLIRPGVMAAQVHDEAAGKMSPVVEKTKWSKPGFAEAARQTLAFKGHLSHGVGMAVHDVGNYQAEPLRPGIVFALDPQLWVPAERLYIRVEDTVVVTDSGNENLTRLAPLELDEVERTMRERGLIDRLPPLGQRRS